MIMTSSRGPTRFLRLLIAKSAAENGFHDSKKFSCMALKSRPGPRHCNRKQVLRKLPVTESALSGQFRASSGFTFVPDDVGSKFGRCFGRRFDG